ncbi:amino acid ABC transporter [Gibbsiella quercinecans]|uniref:amino acid ABC transporter permease n=1 Tax=Gibbsiella quercinecans TaxID=929813 RepID=UPI000EF1B783|nr:amino acid ABC transporter permease [Gibbsiella quercinecans]RLM07630.1 amino acid ABC transporter [Gibbsiella quercinecans]
MQFVLGYQPLQWADSWFLLQGALNTLAMAGTAGVIGTLLGIPLGWARAASFSFQLLSAPLVDIFRSVPMIITLIIFNSMFSMLNMPLSPYVLGSLALGIWMAVVTSEVARACFQSVPRSFRHSARSLGMSAWQELWHISLPLALRNGLSAWVGLLLSLIKDSALAGVIGYVEFMRATQTLITRTHETWLLLVGTGLFYFLICYPISRYSRYLEEKVAI